MDVPTISAFLIVLLSSPLMYLCKCPPQESEALLSLNITLPPTYTDGPWTNDTDCCEWNGITCDQNKRHVLEINVRLNPMLRMTMISGVISDGICKLPFLTDIVIYSMGTTGTLPSCLGDLHFLRSIDIGGNSLSGIIPLTICKLTNMTSLNFVGNQLSGSLPFCLNNLSSLFFLDLSHNRFSGPIPYTWGGLPLLSYLDVSFNQLSGSLPTSFAGLSSLTYLYANGNRFNETTPSLALPSSIQFLHLSLNRDFTISETFFHNLTKLYKLSLSNCTLNISTFWIPNFQLSKLELVSCQMVMDVGIPTWISTQFSLYSLTLANNGHAGEIPSWLWDMTSISELNLSQNHLHGPIFPNGAPKSMMTVLDVSNNALSGRIPSVWPSRFAYTVKWMFNDNLFTGNILPGLCMTSALSLILNLQNNKLDGIIPWCLLEYGSGILELNLGGNNLEGRFPQGLIVSSYIKSLVLNQNQLSGIFLPSFDNDTQLQVLNIGHNKFTGHLPMSIGNISTLQVLIMKDNQFNGNILPEIGKLKNLQILDLSSNNFSGSIPPNIVFLQAMAVARDEGYVLQTGIVRRCFLKTLYFYNFSLGGVDMTPKGTELYYPYIWSTITLRSLQQSAKWRCSP